MKKLLTSLCFALAILALLSGNAFSRGGGGGGGRGGFGKGGGNNYNRPTPTPEPTPTPAPSPVQGIISNVTPFAVSIKTSPQAVEQTFKVGATTTITLNAVPVNIAALKPGMTATITPTADKIYASSVVAVVPVAAATPTPVAVSKPQPQQSPAAAQQTPAQQPPGSASAPFGRPMP